VKRCLYANANLRFRIFPLKVKVRSSIRAVSQHDWVKTLSSDNPIKKIYHPTSLHNRYGSSDYILYNTVCIHDGRRMM